MRRFNTGDKKFFVKENISLVALRFSNPAELVCSMDSISSAFCANFKITEVFVIIKLIPMYEINIPIKNPARASVFNIIAIKKNIKNTIPTEKPTSNETFSDSFFTINLNIPSDNS